MIYFFFFRKSLRQKNLSNTFLFVFQVSWDALIVCLAVDEVSAMTYSVALITFLLQVSSLERDLTGRRSS